MDIYIFIQICKADISVICHTKGTVMIKGVILPHAVCVEAAVGAGLWLCGYSQTCPWKTFWL